MEIDFWAVGQGDGSCISLSPSECILIDVGPFGSPIVRWLSEQLARYGNYHINSLILTHNHADHCGALDSIVGLRERGLTIGKTCLLQHDVTTGKHIKRFMLAIFENEQFFHLQCPIAPDVIWADTNRELCVVFPNYQTVTTASTANERSMILVLRKINGENEFIWSGDAPYKNICTHFNGNAHVLVGPHHGAPQDKPKQIPQNCYKKLFVSLSKTNFHEQFPNKDYIKRTVQSGVDIACTCFTKNCDHSESLIKPSELGHFSPETPKKNGEEVKTYFCRGGMRYCLQNTGCWSIDECDVFYQSARDELIKRLCRP